MSREDTSLPRADLYESDTIELGLDHNGKRQWYISTREGWEEVGCDDQDRLHLSVFSFDVGTRLVVSEPKSHREGDA